MVDKERQIRVLSTFDLGQTLRHTGGHGGCLRLFTQFVVRWVSNVHGITPMPILEPSEPTAYFEGSMVFSKYVTLSNLDQ